jgi:hypothetical protein
MTSVAFLILPILVIIGELINCVVRQMHENVVNVASGGPLVRLCAEARECHLVQINTQRVNTVKENVKTKVVLEILD